MHLQFLPMVLRARGPGSQSGLADRAEHQGAVPEVDGKGGGLGALVAHQSHGEVAVVTAVRASLEGRGGDGGNAVGGEGLEVEGAVMAGGGQCQADHSVHEGEVLSCHLESSQELCKPSV